MYYKQVRLVYRQHLLPKFVIPAKQMKNDDRLAALTYKEKQQMKKIIFSQLLNYKQTYIQPLKKCPFYFQNIDERVRLSLKLKQFDTNNYLLTLEKLSLNQKFAIYKRYKEAYLTFKKDNIFFKQYKNKIKYIPIFIYSKQEDILYNTKPNHINSQVQQFRNKKKILQLYKRYQNQLHHIANEEQLQISQLTDLLQNQISQPHLSAEIRHFLLE